MTQKSSRTLKPAPAQDRRAGDETGCCVPNIVRMLRCWIIPGRRKRNASGISTGEIEKLTGEAMAAGALAGKVSGAGRRGFLCSFVPPEKRLHLVRALWPPAHRQGVKLTHSNARILDLAA